MPCLRRVGSAPPLVLDYDSGRTVLSGELAVPCTRNPLQRG